MFLSDTCIRRPVLATVVLLIVAIFGLSGYVRLGVELFPDIEFPVIVVTTSYPGAGPEEVEKVVTKLIEDGITLVDSVKYVESASSEGMSTLVISFQMGTDIDIAASDVRDQVDQIEGRLPDDAEKPLVMKFDPDAFPIMRTTLSGDKSLMALREMADTTVKTELGKIEGVGLIRIVGGEEREIRVEVDKSRLEANGVSISHVIAAVRSANLELPGGHLTRGDREYGIRLLGEIADAGDIADIELPGTGGSVRVLDVARVVDAAAEIRTKARSRGFPSVGLEILKQGDANAVKVGKGVREAVERLNDGILPEDTVMEIITDDSIFIRDVVAEVRSNMFQGILLTALALYLFLHDLRGTIVIAVAMPVAVIATFILIYFAGYSINIMSMMGLAISVGILVNNAILVLENIHRHIDLGDDPKTAASRGTSEIAVAVASTTLTNVVVFLPIAFMESVVGQVFRQFAMTIVFATLFSLFISFTLTPMLASLLLRGKGSGKPMSERKRAVYARWDGVYDSMSQSYVALIAGILRHPWKTVVAATGIFFLIMFTVPRIIGGEFFPQADEGQFMVDVETDVASAIDYTDRVTKEVGDICASVPEMEQVYSTVGSASGGGEMGAGSSGVNVAQVVVKLVDKAERDRSTEQVINSLRPSMAKIVGARIEMTAGQQGGPGGKPIVLEIRGEDVDVLKRLAAEVMTMSKGGDVGGKTYKPVRGLVDADIEWREGKPEVSLHPQRDRLRIHGVTVQDLAETIRAYYTGIVASRYREGDDEYDIRVRLSESSRNDIGELRDLTVPAADGHLVTLSELAEDRQSSGPTQLTRKDREHVIKVTGGASGRTSGEIHKEMVERIKNIDLPEGYTFNWAGDIEFMEENFEDLRMAMLLATILTYLMLAGLLESWKMSVLIMLSLPLAFAGVFLALLVRGLTINIFSLMGMVMLIGLVINNAIVIVDYINVVRKEGVPLVEAVPRACGIRLRPILMANITTVIAMIPLAMGIGAGGEFRAPMAVTQMGGMIGGGLLALLVTPAIYYLAERKREAKKSA